MVELITLALLAQLAAPPPALTNSQEKPGVEVLEATVLVRGSRSINASRGGAPRPAIAQPIQSVESFGIKNSNRDDSEMSRRRRGSELSKDRNEICGSSSSAPRGGYGAYVYALSFRNHGARAIRSIAYEYKVVPSPGQTIVTTRQFDCKVKVKADKSQRLTVSTALAPTHTVSAETADDRTVGAEVQVNRVEYADGSVWRREGWEDPARPGSEGARTHEAGGRQCRAW
jgi:hypothetical protein